MDLAEATKILDPWIRGATAERFQGKPWPQGSLKGTAQDITITWFLNEQDLPQASARHRWPHVDGRLRPHIAEAITVWTLYHGGPGMLKE